MEADSLNVEMGRDSIQKMDEFNYLGNIITKDGKCKNDIRGRLGQAKTTFYQRNICFYVILDEE